MILVMSRDCVLKPGVADVDYAGGALGRDEGDEQVGSRKKACDEE